MIRYLLGYSVFVCDENVRTHEYKPDSLVAIGNCVMETQNGRNRTYFQRLNRSILPLLDRQETPYHLEHELVWMSNAEEDFRPPLYNPAFKTAMRVVEKVFVVLYSEDDAFLVRLHNGTLPDAA